MSSYSPEAFEMTGVNYMNGQDALVVQCRVPHGRGKRRIGILISPEQVVRFGEVLSPVVSAKDSGARGHAFWHFQHGKPTPCNQCTERTELVVAEPDELLLDETVRPNFGGFLEVLQAEVEWLDKLHRDDKTGQKDSDVRRIEELMSQIKSAGKSLGYL